MDKRIHFHEILELLDGRLEEMELHEEIYDIISRETGLPRIQEVRAKIQQLEVQNFKFLILGNGSSGKSTLINVLLGGHILPSSAGETTTVFTEISYGETPELLVLDRGQTQPRRIGPYTQLQPEDRALFLKDFVCDSQGSYDRVYLKLPSPLLQVGSVNLFT